MPGAVGLGCALEFPVVLGRCIGLEPAGMLAVSVCQHAANQKLLDTVKAVRDSTSLHDHLTWHGTAYVFL